MGNYYKVDRIRWIELNRMMCEVKYLVCPNEAFVRQWLCILQEERFYLTLIKKHTIMFHHIDDEYSVFVLHLLDFCELNFETVLEFFDYDKTVTSLNREREFLDLPFFDLNT